MELQYSILNLVESQYRFNYNFDYSSIERERVSIEMGHDIKIYPEREEIAVDLNAYIMANEELVCQGVRATFNVTPFNDFVQEANENEIKVSQPALIDTFVGVAIGAARGMLVKNLHGTDLQNIILPLVPMSLIRKNITKSK